ncbi:MAG: T9SS type A sorting domain-containing protein [bacterium]|nr:T9SS type A sorting domain-containing protein [bacterium]
MRYFGILFGILMVLVAATSVTAQTDHFGQIDRVSLDSVEVVPGQDVTIRCLLTNDEFLSIVSVPLTYDTTVLTLKSISFDSSRAGYIQTKILTPSQIGQIHGHFVVAVVKMMETPLPPGDGLIFKATFTVAASAPVGTLSIIDSLVFPPGGELMMTESNSSESIRPAFTAGKVVVRGQNRLPVIASPTLVNVLEGDTVKIDVTASDPDGSALSLSCPLKPTSAQFTSTQGNGQLLWVPEYVGPQSADASPLKITFAANDGKATVTRDVTIQVINRNRAPIVAAPERMEVIAGDALQFDISATDPDFEAISWTVNGAPVDASFDPHNPCRFSWNPSINALDDSLPVLFIAADPQGFADTAVVRVVVQAATLYELSIDSTSVLPGDQATLSIALSNQVAVSGFTLMLQYDQSVLTPITVTSAATRTAAFSQFTVTHNPGGLQGSIKIVGVSSAAGPSVSPLPAGTGAIAKLVFRVSSDLAYKGMSIPVRFAFTDPATRTDNTLSSTTGTKIEQTEITYTDGWVKIEDIGTILIGDINLNGLANEIADVIYFTNYFINPAQYTFNVLQYANSDVNGDQLVATIADLVRMISILVSGGAAKPVAEGEAAGEVQVTTSIDGLSLGYHSDVAVGGMLITLESETAIDPSLIESNFDNMTIATSQEGLVTKVLIYSMTGSSMPSGNVTVFSLPGLTDCEVVSVDMSTADGRFMTVALAKGTESLPTDFTLEQNYPNPFNPSTRIDFSLPVAGDVTLVIYDVLGRSIRTLASGSYAAGHHTITWDSRDGSGQAVASGVYFYRLEAGGRSTTRKMMLLK